MGSAIQTVGEGINARGRRTGDKSRKQRRPEVKRCGGIRPWWRLTAGPKTVPSQETSAALAAKSPALSRSALNPSQNEGAYGGARMLSKGVSKLSSRCRILISALARAAGAISNNSREKVTKGICI